MGLEGWVGGVSFCVESLCSNFEVQYDPNHGKKAKQPPVLPYSAAHSILVPKGMWPCHALPSRRRQQAHNHALVRGRVGIEASCLGARPHPPYSPKEHV